eukprot:COSAG01_NODE_1937_length_8860_cov_72.309325_2_plen_439_part_00
MPRGPRRRHTPGPGMSTGSTGSAGSTSSTSASTSSPSSSFSFGTAPGYGGSVSTAAAPATSAFGGHGGFSFGAAPATSAFGGYGGFGGSNSTAAPATSAFGGHGGLGAGPATSAFGGFGGFGAAPAASAFGGNGGFAGAGGFNGGDSAGLSPQLDMQTRLRNELQQMEKDRYYSRDGSGDALELGSEEEEAEELEGTGEAEEKEDVGEEGAGEGEEGGVASSEASQAPAQLAAAQVPEAVPPGRSAGNSWGRGLLTPAAAQPRRVHEAAWESGENGTLPLGCTVWPVGDYSEKVPTNWVASIAGPPDSPYEGGKFLVDVSLPPSYPNAPPHLEMRTRVYHFNVNSSGGIQLPYALFGWDATRNIAGVVRKFHAMLKLPQHYTGAGGGGCRVWRAPAPASVSGSGRAIPGRSPRLRENCSGMDSTPRYAPRCGGGRSRA